MSKKEEKQMTENEKPGSQKEKQEGMAPTKNN